MEKAYSRINWVNGRESLDTPLNDDNLNLMDNALNVIDNRVVQHDSEIQTLQGYETRAAQSAAEALASANSASQSASSASTSASNASASETNAHTSEVNAGASETASATSETNAAQSEENSEAWAVGKRGGVDVGSSDETYHNNSKYYSQQAGSSATAAATSETNAHTSEVNASASETNAATSESNAATSESNASSSASDSSASALVSEGYAVGKQNGTDVTSGSPYYQNNAKYYKDRCEQIVSDLGYPINPKGSITFANLPTTGMEYGWMYNVTDDFTTDNRFIEGSGKHINAGAEVYWTTSDLWSVMAGAGVTGVKGNAEQDYRKGQVNITMANIGINDLDDISTPTITEAQSRTNIATGDNMSTILGKIKKFFTDLKAIAFSGSATDVSFDNTGTSSSETTVQGALTEALSATVPTASDIDYDHTTSGLSATKVQGAIDEINTSLTVINSKLTDKVSVMRYNFTATQSGDWYKDTVESVFVAGMTAIGVVGITPYNNNYIFESYQVQDNKFYATIIHRSGNNITNDVTYSVDILYLKN